jgi:hypothetical protein
MGMISFGEGIILPGYGILRVLKDVNEDDYGSNTSE